jgi:hypothetical protein
MGFIMVKFQARNTVVKAALTSISILLLSGCGMNKEKLEVHFFLNDAESFQNGCFQGSGGYSDISDGMSVTLKTNKGEVVEIGSMRLNTLGGFTQDGTLEGWEDFVDVCNYNYTFESVPGNSDGYVVVIGNGKRGEMVYSKDELDASKDSDGNWNVDITLGN